MTVLDLIVGTVSLIPILLFGLAILGWTGLPSWCTTRIARIALAHLLGASAMAWFVTVAGILIGQPRVLPVYCAGALFVAGSWKPLRRSWITQPPLSAEHKENTSSQTFWCVLLIVVTLAGIATAARPLLGTESLSVDANWNWALKAKALFLDHTFAAVTQQYAAKPNYPILVPLQSWWIYSHLGHVQDWWQQALGFLFYLDLIALTFATCRAYMSSAWAWTATALVANNCLQVRYAAHGQADTQLTAYMMGSAVCMAGYLAQRDKTSRRLALLLLMGALQTKNEGVSWAAFAVVILAWSDIRQRSYRQAARSLGAFLLAVAPWTLYKRMHGLVYGPEEPLAKLADLKVQWWWRIETIVDHHATFTPLSLVFLLLLCIPLIWRGWSRVSKPVLALIAAQFASYLVIYFIVQRPYYQLHFKARGLSQLAPALICVCLIGYHEWVCSQPALTVHKALLSTASTLP